MNPATRIFSRSFTADIRLPLLVVALCALLTGLMLPVTALAGGVEVFEIHIKDHRFHPDEVRVPAGKKIKLIVHNDDDTIEEFESFELNREKLVRAGRKISVFLPPLKPGEYPFFGEFHADTAQGKIIAE